VNYLTKYIITNAEAYSKTIDFQGLWLLFPIPITMSQVQ
jgi:hypothetical protein